MGLKTPHENRAKPPETARNRPKPTVHRGRSRPRLVGFGELNRKPTFEVDFGNGRDAYHRCACSATRVGASGSSGLCFWTPRSNGVFRHHNFLETRPPPLACNTTAFCAETADRKAPVAMSCNNKNSRALFSLSRESWAFPSWCSLPMRATRGVRKYEWDGVMGSGARERLALDGGVGLQGNCERLASSNAVWLEYVLDVCVVKLHCNF